MPHSIALVDDDQNILTSLSAALEDEGYKVDTYADGSDAIHIVPNSRNLPAEFSEIRYAVRVEKLALCPDSGGPGKRRGGGR